MAGKNSTGPHARPAGAYYTPGVRIPAGLGDLARAVFPWPLVPLPGRPAADLASIAALAALLASRLLLLPAGPWEQDEALLACGVVAFDPAQHMPLPPGFPLWIVIGRLVRLLGVADPLIALQVASSVFSVIAAWALVGLWDRVAGRPVALLGAGLAAFLPGVWFHAPRAFSETPAAALAIVGFAAWVAAGRAGYVAGVAAMTAAALVRPPLAPFFVLAVVLASWGVRRDLRRVVGAAGVAALLLAVVMVPLALEAGGARALLGASVEHGSEHFGLLGTEPWSLATLGFTRGLGAPAAAVAFAALALLGWARFRRALGWRWAAGTTAAAMLVFLLLALHNSSYPRYWVLVWLLGATPAVAGLAVALRRTTVLAVAAVVATAASWVLPALLHAHRNPLPVVAALAHAGERSGGGEAVLLFEDQLFSFRNLAVRQGWFTVPSLRLGEVAWPRVEFGGRPVWFLSEAAAPDLDSPTSQVVEFEARLPALRRLSQERFLHARLVRDPVVVWSGGSPPEWAGIRRFVWCGPQSTWLVPPIRGAGRLAIDALVPQELDGVGVTARVAGVETLAARLGGGRQLLLVPLPDLPDASRLNRVLPVELAFDRSVAFAGDGRPLALRVYRAAVEAEPYTLGAYAFTPSTDSAARALTAGTGWHGSELLGSPPRPAAWTGARAALDLPVSRGVIGVELLAPRPGPIAVELALGEASARVVVGDEPITVALPVTPSAATARRARLEIASPVFVPGPGDPRELGVAVARVWFQPAEP
jgi:hypothetical protein